MVLLNKDAFQIFFACCVYIASSFGIKRSRYGRLLPAFDELISYRSVMTTVRSRSRIECRAACLEESTCHSFFYTPNAETCQLHSTVLDFYTSDADRSKGTRYVQLSEETQSGCPYWAEQRGYTYNSTIDICYFYQKAGTCTSVNAAYDKCADDGGHLLFVPDQGTDDWLNRMLQDSGETPYVVYIDGTDKVTETTFKNYRNEALTYTHWKPDEPHGLHPDENCIAIFYSQWIDLRCAKSYMTHSRPCGFVCQIDTQ